MDFGHVYAYRASKMIMDTGLYVRLKFGHPLDHPQYIAETMQSYMVPQDGHVCFQKFRGYYSPLFLVYITSYLMTSPLIYLE